MKRKLILTVVGLILVVGLIGAYFYFKTTPDVVQDKPDFSVKASDLIAAFDKDTAAARKQYIDKIVEVTGLVKKIDSANAITLGEEGSASEVIAGKAYNKHTNPYQCNQVSFLQY